MTQDSPAIVRAFAETCAGVVGATHLWTDPADMAPYSVDWRGRYHGAPCAVVAPADTAEVAAVVRAAAAAGIGLVPQGGNTGLAGGATPHEAHVGRGPEAVLSLRRMARIRTVDPVNDTLIAEAGCILANVQGAAREADRLFPLSLAAEGSCTIGGNLSTNAGGTAVLRYGNARDLCTGLEVVTANGDIWHGLRGLRKDNTGYDLRDLFIGAEGTLGIITAAALKLFPAPAAQVTALAGLATPAAALALLALLRRRTGALLTGFELISALCLRLVAHHFPALRQPFGDAYPYCVLIELSDHEDAAHAGALLERVLGEALERAIIDDATVAQTLAQSKEIWGLREHIPLAQAADGLNIKHDISVPISAIGRFLEETDALIAAAVPDARLVTFGHLGDGNLHYNVQAPSGDDGKRFLDRWQAPINGIVYDSVARHHGSISAEHGLGQLKVDDAARFRPAIETSLMMTIKRALDPHNLMNPGKVVRFESS